MPGIYIEGKNGNRWDVDGGTFEAAKVSNRPAEYERHGTYSLGVRSSAVLGVIAAGTASAGHLFAFRWADPREYLCAVEMLKVRWQTQNPFTAATLTNFGFDAFIVRAYSQSHSGGTTLTTAVNSTNFAQRIRQGTSLVSDIKLTSGSALTTGTHTFDAQPFAMGIGKFMRTNPATGTEDQLTNTPSIDWQPIMQNGEAPIILARNEGIVIRNRTLMPASGNGFLTVEMRWSELTRY